MAEKNDIFAIMSRDGKANLTGGEDVQNKRRYTNARNLLMIIRLCGMISSVLFFTGGLFSFVAALAESGGMFILPVFLIFMSGFTFLFSLAQAEFGEAFLDMADNSNRSKDVMEKLLSNEFSK